MKKLIPVMVSVVALFSSTTAYANSSGQSAVTSGSNYVILDRAPIAGPSDAVGPSKYSIGKPDSAALSALMQGNSYRTMLQAYNNGEMVIVRGNADGALSDLLLESAFEPSSIPKLSDQTNYSQSNQHLVAIGIEKIPGDNVPGIFSVNANIPSDMTTADIVNALQSEYCSWPRCLA